VLYTWHDRLPQSLEYYVRLGEKALLSARTRLVTKTRFRLPAGLPPACKEAGGSEFGGQRTMSALVRGAASLSSFGSF
jgi:hypothetical protein